MMSMVLGISDDGLSADSSMKQTKIETDMQKDVKRGWDPHKLLALGNEKYPTGEV